MFDPAEVKGHARILLVDDEPANIRLLEQVLRRAGYRYVHGTTEPLQVERLFVEVRPDLVVLDLIMPELDGFGVLRRLQPHLGADEYLPVLVLTGDQDPNTRRRALVAGGRDFVTKPFDVFEVLVRIYNLLEIRFLNRQLTERADELEARVRERTAELEAAQDELLERLAMTAEFRVPDIRAHTIRVGELAERIGMGLGMAAADAAILRRAAMLHDLGKGVLPLEPQLRSGPLTAEEVTVMARHTELGGRLLAGSSFPVLRMAELIARTHHERWDGSGYPRGLAGEAIPLEGRIVAAADVFDALTHDRVYKPAWPVETALAEIQRTAGSHFDPRVVDALMQAVHNGAGQPASEVVRPAIG
jgi:putative two-component system response regulator